jgi:hypothetical protein
MMNRSKRKNARLRAERIDDCRKSYREHVSAIAQEKEQIHTQRLAVKHDPYADANAFIRVISKKAPKLLDDHVSRMAIDHMRKISSFRCVEDWKPKGKGYQALLVSLANHLFAVYSVPSFIWSIFWDEPNLMLSKLVTKVAGGASLYSLTANGRFPVPLTKKQCHALLKMPAKFSFIEAVRYVQVMAAGGDLTFFEQWIKSQHVRTIQSLPLEQFWSQVLVWLGQQQELQPKMVLRLIDYIAFLRSNHGNFSLKGRTLPNLLFSMQEWQRLERLQKLAMGLNLPESGLMSSRWESLVLDKRTKQVVKKHWTVSEILSEERLLNEGRTMKHCVYSYRKNIHKGRCSIWSVSCNKQPLLTLEVNNSYKQIVQVKGKNNREPLSTELPVIKVWAELNGLKCH